MKRNILRSITYFVLIILFIMIPFLQGDFSGGYNFEISAAGAAEELEEGDFTYRLEGDNAVITAYTGFENTEVVVPETLGDCPVREIEGFAVSDETVTSIVIPESVADIDSLIFKSLYALEKITVSELNESFSSDGGVLFDKEQTVLIAFPKKNEKTVYELPLTVRFISKYAFYSCVQLTQVVLPEGLEEIGLGAFSQCALTQLEIPESVKKIGEYSVGYYNLETVENFVIYGKDNSAAEYYALMGGFSFNEEICESAQDDNFIYNVMNGKAVVTGCINEDILDLTVPSEFEGNSVVYIGSGAYFYHSALRTVTVPDSVKHIGEAAFADNQKLERVRIGSGVESVGYSAFSDCPNLKAVVIPSNVTDIAPQAFGYVTDEKIYEYVKLEGFTVYGEAGSAAEQYAAENGFAFIQDDIIPLENPAKITAKQNVTQIKLTWTWVADADGYEVLLKEGKKWQSLGTTAETSMLLTDLASGRVYTFGVRAFCTQDDDIMWADGLTTVETTTLAAVIEKISSTSTDTAIKLSWDKVEGATGYRIFYLSDNKWYVSVSSTAKTSVTIKELENDTSYTFAVRPYIKNSQGVLWSNYTTVTVSTKKPEIMSLSAPESLTATQNATAIKLSWSQVENAEGYRIYVKTGDSWRQLGYTSRKEATVKNLAVGTKYNFAVRAYAETSKGLVLSDEKTIETATVPSAVNVKTAVSKNMIALSWNSLKGISGYRVYYRDSASSSWKTAVAATTKNIYVLNNLSAGKTYIFAVRPAIKTSSGLVWGSYKQVSATTAEKYKFERYYKVLKSGTYYFTGKDSNYSLLTVAKKNGKTFIQLKADGTGIRQIYGGSGELWYLVNDNKRVYTKVTSDKLDNLQAAQLSTHRFKAATAKIISGKLYACEIYNLGDGSQVTYYFSGNTLVRSDTIYSNKSKNTVIYSKFTNKVADSVFSVPDGYKEHSGGTVYVTPSGKKYHYSAVCAGANSKATTLVKAKNSSYAPCSKCGY